jgi:hypothetical protein
MTDLATSTGKLLIQEVLQEKDLFEDFFRKMTFLGTSSEKWLLWDFFRKMTYRELFQENYFSVDLFKEHYLSRDFYVKITNQGLLWENDLSDHYFMMMNYTGTCSGKQFFRWLFHEIKIIWGLGFFSNSNRTLEWIPFGAHNIGLFFIHPRLDGWMVAYGNVDVRYSITKLSERYI